MSESMDRKVTSNKEQGHAERSSGSSSQQSNRAVNAAISQLAAHAAKQGKNS